MNVLREIGLEENPHEQVGLEKIHRQTEFEPNCGAETIGLRESCGANAGPNERKGKCDAQTGSGEQRWKNRAGRGLFGVGP